MKSPKSIFIFTPTLPIHLCVSSLIACILCTKQKKIASNKRESYLPLIITLRLTCLTFDERKIYSTIKKSRNIMNNEHDCLLFFSFSFSFFFFFFFFFFLMPLLIALIVRNSHIFTEIFIFLKIVFEIYPDVYQYITHNHVLFHL